MNVVVLLAARPLGLPVVVAELTDPRFHPLPRIWRLLRRWLYPQAAAVVAVSRASAAEVSRLTGRPAEVILNAVDLPEGLPKVDRRDRGREEARGGGGERPNQRLVTVGRLAEEKRQHLLIDAFDRLAERYPQWRLEIAGSGPLQAELQARIDRSEARQRIELCGRVFPIWPFLQEAEAFALTSRYEGTPVALLEAMAAGCACVAIDNDSGAGELICDGQNGLLAADSLDALTAALDRLLGDPPLRRRLAEAAQMSAAQHNWDRSTDAYEQVLQRAVATARP
jgi:GalNAc-alpha-(1->4)-GalNAc-alpha-(1->3)-diNAcBac-PP-undecaprenol alpha-1,4-N-acetyl-D-galactosaminyltransferase